MLLSKSSRLAFVILVALLVVPGCLEAPDVLAGSKNRWLYWADLLDTSRMLERFHEANTEDAGEAREMLDMGLRNTTRSNWGGGLKAFVQSAGKKPSVKALLGLSYCQTRWSAEASNCVESVSRRLCIFEGGVNQLQAAIEFHGVLGKASDVDEKTIAEYQMKIIQAQKMLLDDQRKCMNPRTIQSTIGKKQR